MDDISVTTRKHSRISDRLPAKLYPAEHSPALSHHAQVGSRIARPARGLLDQQGPMQQPALANRDCEFSCPNRKAGVLHAAGGCSSRKFRRALIGATDIGCLYWW